MERTKHEMALMSQIANLRQSLRAKEQELREERIRKCGVNIGDIVLYRGEEFRVAGIDVTEYRMWLIGNPRKKNGEFGNAVRNLYTDWTLASQAAEERKS
ncbi:hypothetical protein [Pandoraea sputorum]|uniref:hypothetical protein n=1 Tax=Pandoraea sputorum TaxID=93222 RepID=UPI0012426761|nr:hypothetical protein [Pandoraea sputorum]VVE07431.1 hypothetical protein PSP20601_02469 [Pandoraea sputorum]